MTDREVVDAFGASLRKRGHSNLEVTCRPDEINRASDDIDAVAGSFAIEHTSIDTFPHQRRDSERFMQVFGVLEAEFREGLPFYRGRRRAAVVRDPRSVGGWVLHSAGRLPDGGHVVRDVAGLPFPLHVRKSCSRRAGLFVSRSAPADDTMPARVKSLLDRRAHKHARYKHLGYTTVLLVESGDLALMNEGVMLAAVAAAYPSGLIVEVDQVWYADTLLPKRPEFIDFTAELRAV